MHFSWKFDFSNMYAKLDPSKIDSCVLYPLKINQIPQYLLFPPDIPCGFFWSSKDNGKLAVGDTTASIKDAKCTENSSTTSSLWEATKVRHPRQAGRGESLSIVTQLFFLVQELESAQLALKPHSKLLHKPQPGEKYRVRCVEGRNGRSCRERKSSKLLLWANKMV